MADLPLPMKGHCYCEKVQYTLNASPIFVNCCHCRDCQSLTGSSFALNIMVETSAISLTSTTQPTEKREERVDKDSTGNSYHCPLCGVMLWGTLGQFGPGVTFLRAGNLAENEKVQPDAHFFVRSKHPWITIPEGVKTFETMPGKDDGPMFSKEAERRFKAAIGGK